MQIKVGEFRKLIREAAEEKKNHPEYVTQDGNLQPPEFSFRNVWQGVSQEIKNGCAWEEALNKSLDDLTVDAGHYKVKMK